MEYFLSPDGQIQADIAYRLGKIAIQYESLNLPLQENFDSTLHISILQNLLTNCVELLNNLDSVARRDERLSLKIDVRSQNYFNLNESMVLENSLLEEISIDEFFRQLRNSLSHPTKVDLSSQYPSTGYKTIPNETGIISTYIFIASPDTKDNRPKSFRSLDLLKAYFQKVGKTLEWEQKNGYYIITTPRLLKIKLTSLELKELTLKLCTYLAQPVQHQWNGLEFNDKLLAA